MPAPTAAPCTSHRAGAAYQAFSMTVYLMIEDQVQKVSATVRCRRDGWPEPPRLAAQVAGGARQQQHTPTAAPATPPRAHTQRKWLPPAIAKRPWIFRLVVRTACERGCHQLHGARASHPAAAAALPPFRSPLAFAPPLPADCCVITFFAALIPFFSSLSGLKGGACLEAHLSALAVHLGRRQGQGAAAALRAS